MATDPGSAPRLLLYLAEPSNEGEQLLREILTRRSFSAVARRLGVTHVAVRAWARGMSIPSPRRRDQIQRVLGVPAEAWNEPARWRA